MHRGVLLLFALVNVSAILLVHRCSAQGNGSCNVEWQLQPIQEVLPCDPFGVDITLECSSDPATLTVSWFWTQNVSQAGINGTQILLGASQYTVTSIVTGFQRLLFNVNEFTVGYYWCEILDAGEDTRPSAIVALCSDSSLTQCSDPYENVSHNIHLECAIQEPNFRVSHSGLPMECAAPPSVTYQSTSAYVSPSGLTTKSLITSNSMTTILSTAHVSSYLLHSPAHISPSLHSPSSVIDLMVTMTTNTAFFVTDSPPVIKTVSQAIACPHNSSQPSPISNKSLPWATAVVVLGVILIISIAMHVFSVIIIYKQKRTIAILRTQPSDKMLGIGSIAGKRSEDGTIKDISSSLKVATIGDVQMERNVAYEDTVFNLGTNDGEHIYDN